MLGWDRELQDKYTVAVKNRFMVLSDGVQDETATDKYGRFTKAISDTTEELVPQVTRSSRLDPSQDSRVMQSRETVTEAYRSYHQNPDVNNRQNVKIAKEQLDQTYMAVHEELLTNKVAAVEAAAIQAKHRQSWVLINDICGKRKAGCGLIKGDSNEDKVKVWENHFRNLLGEAPLVDEHTIPERETDLNISTEPFSRAELFQAKKLIKENKACGDDGIPPEVVRRCNLDDIILDFCNNTLMHKHKPEQWSILNIVPVPKKGDLTNPNNYRGIALSSIVAKTLNRMILNRIRPEVEKILRINQNGFRPGRSTTSHILTLRRVIEGVKARNLTAVMTFVDFKKAFDTVHRGTMMAILRAYGIPSVIVDVIRLLYTGTKAKVVTPDGQTDIFDILAGVLQGNTLAPYLFVIVIDYCMNEAIGDDEAALGLTLVPAKSRRVKPVSIVDAEFADDIALLSNDIRQADELLKRVERSAKKVGLHMNESKTKVLGVNIDTSGKITTDAGNTLETVEDFVYLGAWVESTEHDIKVGKAKAWAAYHKLKTIWKSKLSDCLKRRLFIATVESVLLYGSETWTLDKRLEKGLDGCYTRMLRMAMNVNWRDHMTNKELYGKFPQVTAKIRQRRLKLAGHCQRHPELLAQKLILWEPTQGYSRKGRKKYSFIEGLRDDTGLRDVKEIRTMMENRELWGDLSNDVWEIKHPP